MTPITRDQARALASLVAALRPDWDSPGILKALSDARERGNPFALAHAALYAAETLTNRTPAVIALTGDHWTKGRALGESNPIRFDRCPEPGHGSFPAHNCSSCRSEGLESSEPRPERSAADIEAYTRGAQAVREALGRTDDR